MWKRRLRRVAAGLVLAGVTAFVLWPRPGRATRANYGRIREGMSRAEVYAIVGPPGDYSTGPMDFGGGHIISPWDLIPKRLEPNEDDAVPIWLTDNGWISVAFDEHGKATMPEFEPCTRARQGPLDNLLWRIRQQWWRWFGDH